MATSIHPSIPVLSPSFLYHPYIPSFQSKDFSFTCLLPFFGCTLHILNSLRNNILPQAICCCFFIEIVLYMYACQLLLLQLLIWASYNLDRLPEAILLFTVIDVLLIMCLLAFFVTSADKSPLFVYLCYLLIYCLRLLNFVV